MPPFPLDTAYQVLGTGRKALAFVWGPAVLGLIETQGRAGSGRVGPTGGSLGGRGPSWGKSKACGCPRVPWELVVDGWVSPHPRLHSWASLQRHSAHLESERPEGGMAGWPLSLPFGRNASCPFPPAVCPWTIAFLSPGSAGSTCQGTRSLLGSGQLNGRVPAWQHG